MIELDIRRDNKVVLLYPALYSFGLIGYTVPISSVADPDPHLKSLQGSGSRR